MLLLAVFAYVSTRQYSQIPITQTQMPTPTPTLPDLVSEITQSFALKYDKPRQAIEISVEVDTGEFAKGSVRFTDEFGGAIWFGAKQGGKWVLAADGQGPMSCDIVNRYNFPTDIVPECMSDNQELVER